MHPRMNQFIPYKRFFSEAQWDQVIELVEADKKFEVNLHSNFSQNSPEIQIGAALEDFHFLERWVEIKELT